MTEETPATKAEQLVAEVAQAITQSDSTVRERLIEAMVDREVSSRVTALDTAFKKRLELSRALNKVDRADTTMKDKDGKVVQEYYSDGRRKEIKKATEALQKFDNAMEQALTGNFQKLRELS